MSSATDMELPVLLITNGVLLPEARLRIPIRSKTNLAMLDRFIVNKVSSAKSLVLVAYRVDDESKRVHETATVALVEQVVCWSYNSHLQYTLHLLGVSRVKITNFAIPLCMVKQLYSVQGNIDPKKREQFIVLAREVADRQSSDDLRRTLLGMADDGRIDELTDLAVASIESVGYQELLKFLSTLEVSARIELAIPWLKAYVDSKPSKPLRDTVNIERLVGPALKLRPIPGSGEKREKSNPIAAIEKKLQEANLPDNVKGRVFEDLERLKAMGPHSSEHHVLMGYLELVADLPWNKSTEDKIDIPKAREALDATHEGMEQVKRRLLEFLAVRRLGGNINGPILCLSGPPGIGKTSVAKAIAQALGRKFERISLGGTRDESEIRGHRRTYVAAMPGRLIQAIRHAGTNNPLILLDEVDKLFVGNSGSPSAALLEVLDPEQNNSFQDRYLGLPFDLSKVIFIATANDPSNIEGPLKDRMEMVEMNGYSTAEKMAIAGKHLVPRQRLAHGICPDHVVFHPDALLELVEGYTREAGIRQLERNIAAICRDAALKLAEAANGTRTDVDTLPSNLELPMVIHKADCERILGPPRYSRLDVDLNAKRMRPGMAFGLAWTPFGGEVMVIETSRCEGRGRTHMTGKLGEVLRESVEVARSLLGANSERWGTAPLDAGDDIHVHLPSGAVGKDGPSAGAALTAALYSLASGRKLRADTALTGEISLTGQVLPVGGIKEKVLGAHRAGIKRVLLPLANKSDYEQLDEAIKKEVEVHFVSEIDEVLNLIVEKGPAIDLLSKL